MTYTVTVTIYLWHCIFTASDFTDEDIDIVIRLILFVSYLLIWVGGERRGARKKESWMMTSVISTLVFDSSPVLHQRLTGTALHWSLSEFLTILTSSGSDPDVCFLQLSALGNHRPKVWSSHYEKIDLHRQWFILWCETNWRQSTFFMLIRWLGFRERLAFAQLVRNNPHHSGSQQKYMIFGLEKYTLVRGGGVRDQCPHFFVPQIA